MCTVRVENQRSKNGKIKRKRTRTLPFFFSIFLEGIDSAPVSFFLSLFPSRTSGESTADVLECARRNPLTTPCDVSRENHTAIRTLCRTSLDTGPGGEPTRRCQ
ncbi:hypothetical protein P5V15_010568 [Pogonomyrmex californicus]